MTISSKIGWALHDNPFVGAIIVLWICGLFLWIPFFCTSMDGEPPPWASPRKGFENGHSFTVVTFILSVTCYITAITLFIASIFLAPSF